MRGAHQFSTWNPRRDRVSVVPVTSADAHTLDGADLAVVGGPTHTHGDVQTENSGDGRDTGRKRESEVELVPGADSGQGVREWLASLGRLEIAGAAFDTATPGIAGVHR